MQGVKLHWWNRIKVRVLIFGAVMSIIPVVLVSSYYLFYAKHDLQKSVQANNTLFVANIAAKTDAYLQQIEDQLNAMLFTFPVGLPQDTVQIQIYHLLKEIPGADQIVILDRNEHVEQAVDRFKIIDNLSQLNWSNPNLLSSLQNRKTYYSPVTFSETGIPSVAIVVPRYSPDGRTFLGGLGVRLQLRSLFTFISLQKPSNKEAVFFVDGSGSLIAHNDFVRVLQKTNVSKSFSVQHFLNKGDPNLLPIPNQYTSYNGQEVLGVYNKVSKTGWAVVVEQPVSVAFASINALLFRLFWFLIAIVLGSVSISIIFGLYFTRPIERLERGVRSVSSGDLVTQISSERKDELGHLADSFNEMTTKLRVQSETLLQEKDRLDTIVKGIGAGLALINVDHTVAWMNPLLEKWLVSRQPTTDQELIALLTQHLANRVFLHQLYNLEHVGQGKPYYLMVVEDITEHRRMEEIAVQADKLSALGLMASGFAHEINNPLSTIQVHAEDLEERLKTEKSELLLSEEIERYLGIIRKNVGRAKKITENLLNFSRKSEWKQEWIYVPDILEESLSLFNHIFVTKKVSIQREWEPTLPRIRGDALQLMQVIVNLLNNALDAVSPKGDIRIQAYVDKQELVIRIDDNGTGIEQENLNKVFNPFFTTKELGKGTGLGLSICYGIVSRMGGSICLESEKGVGTEATVTLPIEEEKPNV